MFTTVEDVESDSAILFATSDLRNELGVYASTSCVTIQWRGRDLTVFQNLNIQNDTGTTGGVVWSSTLQLSELIDTSIGLRGKVVLELGSGTGISGLLLGEECHLFIATDWDEAILRLIHRNLRHQRNTSILQLDWTDDARTYLHNVKQITKEVDYILCLDCIYSSFLAAALVETLIALTTQFSAKVIIGQQLRDESVHLEFMQSASQAFRISRYESDDAISGYVLLLLERL